MEIRVNPWPSNTNTKCSVTKIPSEPEDKEIERRLSVVFEARKRIRHLETHLMNSVTVDDSIVYGVIFRKPK